MEYIKKLLYLFTLSLLVFACKEDPRPYRYYGNGYWIYTNGDAEVEYDNYVEIEFDIENNLTVDGSVKITDGLSIGNNININNGGKIEIDIPWDSDTVYIDQNVNVNDTLNILKGHVIVDGNFNLNATGFVNVSDSARLVVHKNFNTSGQLYGNRNIYVQGAFHQNSGYTQAAPYNY